MLVQMGCLEDSSLWMDTSRGVFCHGPEGPWCDFGNGFEFNEDLSLDAELVKEDILVRYLTSRKQDRKVVEGLWWWGGPSQLTVDRPAVVSTLTDTILAVGSGGWEEEWGCVGEREELANGATRFTLQHDGMYMDLRLWFDWGSEAREDWLAQAPSVFHAHGIFLEGDMDTYTNACLELVLPRLLTGWLSHSKAKQRRRQKWPIYLFIPQHSASTFWSFDPDGQNAITTDLCHYLGLPISLEQDECWESSCPTEVYKAMETYQIARGFDPNTTEFARHNQFRTFEITEQPFTGRFEEIDDSGAFNIAPLSPLDYPLLLSEPTKTSLHSIQPEELDDMFLGVLFGEVMPEGELVNNYHLSHIHLLLRTDFTMNTTTQGYALQKDFVGIPDTAHTEYTLPKDLKSVTPSETKDVVPREANVWSRFIPKFSWAALEDSEIHSAGF
ncbi:hypothetical protein V5O48_003147 [Marasmius crinis-equi]|uniref:Uncharacterized protein n=1 Tax=Marasmius crinis-equi TaxID=585013 RepID=A0ABR3FTP6_9AGAR